MLLTVEDVKSFLGMTVNDDDDKIMPACQSAQDEAENFVDYKLEGSTFTEFQDNDGVDIIQLRNIPVKSITSIHDDWDRAYGSDTLVDSTEYAFNDKTGIVTGVGISFSKGVNNIKAVYLAGYNGIGATAYTNLPYDLKQALIYLACSIYLEGKAGINVLESQEIVYRPKYLKETAEKILQKYRRISV
jgi:hypothetical protein